jgi:hypothetical protein
LDAAIFTAGFEKYPFDSGQDLKLSYLGSNVGWFASGGGIHPEREWLIVQPVVGSWSWANAPEGSGTMAGVILGLRGCVRKRHPLVAVSVASGFIWLFDVDGESNAEVHTIALRLEVSSW